MDAPAHGLQRRLHRHSQVRGTSPGLWWDHPAPAEPESRNQQPWGWSGHQGLLLRGCPGLTAAGGPGSGSAGGPQLSALCPAGTCSPSGPAWRPPPTTGRGPRTSSTPSTRTWWSCSRPPRWAEAGLGDEEQASARGTGRGGGAAPARGPGPGPGWAWAAAGRGLARYRVSGTTLYFSNKASRTRPPPPVLAPGTGAGAEAGPGVTSGRAGGGRGWSGGGAAPARGGASVAARGRAEAGAGSRAQVRGARCHGDGRGPARGLARPGRPPLPPAAAPSPAEPPRAQPSRAEPTTPWPGEPRPAPGPAAAPGSAQPRASLSAPPCPAWFTTGSAAAARAPPAPAARSSRRPTRRTCASSTRVSGAEAAGLGGPRPRPGLCPGEGGRPLTHLSSAWQCVERDLRSQMGSERGLVEEYVEKMPNPSLKGEGWGASPRQPSLAPVRGHGRLWGAAMRPLLPKSLLSFL